MIKNLFTLLLFLFSSSLLSQNEADNWYFGINAGLNFNSGTPIVLTDSQLATEEGCATISDQNGNLLFYTDGNTVWNRNHTILSNGTGLLGDESSTQSAIIIKKPNDNSIYYVFTVDDTGGENGVNYSEVDMTLDNGLGGVNSNKNIQLHTPTSEKLTAIKHPSNNEFWVLIHSSISNTFLSYKINSSGVNLTPVISNVGEELSFDSQGVLKFSPDGTKVAMCSSDFGLELFDFDVDSGIVSNARTLLDSNLTYPWFYGVGFSSNSKILYASQQYVGVFQFNLEAGSTFDVVNSKIQIADLNNISNNGNFGSLQLASDGKIYVARYSSLSLDVINNPNDIGISCNYSYSAVYLEGNESRYGLPPFIQSYFNINNVTYTNTCFGDTTEFTLNNTVDSVIWDFGDPTSGANTTSTLTNPTHVFTAPGTYTVTTTTTLGTETSTITTEVVIHEQPTATQPTNMLVCDASNNGFHNFNLTTQNSAILNGQNASDFSVAYYASMTDYHNDNPIPDFTSYQNTTAYQSQTIIASVKNRSNTSCEATITFSIQVFESPRPALPADIPNLSDCDNTSVGTDTDGRIEFDLTDRDTTILNGQSNTNFEVSYFTDAAYTMQIPTSDVTTFENTSNPQTIYVRVTNINNTTCVEDTSFVLEVFELPTVTPVVALRQCDDDIDGFSFFNLTEVNEEIITNSSSYTITYYETQTLAESGTSPITNFTVYENETASTDTVWARIENANECFRTSQINLLVSTTHIPLTYIREFYKCDDGTNTSDGIATFDFSQVTTEIESFFPVGQQLIIKYYQSEAEALTEENPIPDAAISSYQNTASPNIQDIYIRVDSAIDNDCLGLGHHITLNVVSQPVANSVTINPECDNDRDGLFTFDTSTIHSTLVGSQTNVTVTYTDENGVALPSPLPNPFSTESQAITARVTNNTSQDPDVQCYVETTIDFVVNNVPIANPIAPLEQCDDDTDGIIAFDTSAVESTILGTQTGMVVKYFDENGTVLPSPLPNPFTTASQTITVRIENPLYAVCFEETNVEFIVREKPIVKIEPDTIICMTATPSKNISVENPNSTYTYTWYNQNGIQIGEGEAITINQGGVYSVIGTSQFNCDSERDEIIVIESEVATLLVENIQITDDSSNNTVEINTSNLGIGNYEFALLDIDLDIVYSFQDSPIFTNLVGGVYTVQIRDKNGCGIEEQEILVITYPNFITPNNDGHNDFWEIKGFSTSFYPSSKVYIYDRFGKVIAELPAENPIWNGDYNGKPAPSNDYWFSVQLIDSNGNIRTNKGHFSLLRK
ncbi:T9SS type B sorting domain-containing protein [Tenacibaculum sp. SG-28]|uniref:T9SS type B sorting domain-containing protein n=1 Tax=Tenacibaculum sp. SG-28 TaxID=754426 RepID=UPI000CF3D7DF|nr:T9SS type B sorting domain-containing protein [Tenacibaculum sp. SG-28]PQJ19583.1 hypothetical protein BSU00_12280 [Tenacibaculum sp. SG-28]